MRCKKCGEEVEIISEPEDQGAYEIYCRTCCMYLDDEGDIINEL